MKVGYKGKRLRIDILSFQVTIDVNSFVLGGLDNRAGQNMQNRLGGYGDAAAQMHGAQFFLRLAHAGAGGIAI